MTMELLLAKIAIFRGFFYSDDNNNYSLNITCYIVKLALEIIPITALLVEKKIIFNSKKLII